MPRTATHIAAIVMSMPVWPRVVTRWPSADMPRSTGGA